MKSHTDNSALVPLLFAEIPEIFKTNKPLKKLADSLCHKYAKQFGKRLGVPVIWFYTPHNNVEFRLISCNDVNTNHEYYTQEIFKYCMAHKYIFSYINICNKQGKIISTTNRYHAVCIPTRKGPH